MADRITPTRLTKQELREVLGGGVLIIGIPPSRASLPEDSSGSAPPRRQLSEEELLDTKWNQRRIEGWRRFAERLHRGKSVDQVPPHVTLPPSTPSPTDAPIDGGTSAPQ
jgi:hypothetical protein